jgi:hypothetical protein
MGVCACEDSEAVYAPNGFEFTQSDQFRAFISFSYVCKPGIQRGFLDLLIFGMLKATPVNNPAL